MGLFDGWPFKSKEQMEREKQEFEERVFPFGAPQREACMQVLQQLLHGKRLKDSDRMFTFILAKDRYMLDKKTDEALETAREKIAGMRWVPAEEIDLLLALVRLDAEVEDLASYPTAEDVLRAAGRAAPTV